MSTSKLEYVRGETLATKYEVVDLLGEGPLGLSYRVKHMKSGTYLRLLLLRPTVAGVDATDKIVNAFQVARNLKHPNLIKIGELGEADSVAYVTMEDFDGITLRSLISQHLIDKKPFELRHAARIITGILEGLEAIHKAGSVMRSLRPENVLVHTRRTGPRQRGTLTEVRLTTGFLSDLVESTALVEDEFTRGEAQYLGPELKSFEPFPTPRTDIYSAGVIFYELLVGQPPVGTFQLPRARRPDLPEHLNTVVELALAQSPDDRYPGARAFIADVQRMFEGIDDTIEKKPVITPLGWGLALVIVVLIGFLVFTLRPNPEKEAEAADSQLRASVIEQQDRPSDAEIRSIQSRHPQNMIFIPTGPYVRGRLHRESSRFAPVSEPLAQVVDVPAFLIDAFESPNLKGSAPTNRVNYPHAEAACATAGKRLCTADEWEKACKGPRNTVYSWGDDFSEHPCGLGLEALGASGSRPDCKSGWGVFDVSGNYREWTSTPPKGKKNRRILKGGLKGNPEKGTRCGLSTDSGTAYQDATIAFRCCRDLDGPPVE